MLLARRELVLLLLLVLQDARSDSGCKSQAFRGHDPSMFVQNSPKECLKQHGSSNGKSTELVLKRKLSRDFNPLGMKTPSSYV
jgi:hypothetical protein